MKEAGQSNDAAAIDMDHNNNIEMQQFIQFENILILKRPIRRSLRK
jgi:hypothetical protein